MGIDRDPAFTAPAYRFEFTSVVRALVFPPEGLTVLLLDRVDPGKFIRFELVVLRGMAVVKSPLLEWNIFGDKFEKHALLTIKIIDD